MNRRILTEFGSSDTWSRWEQCRGLLIIGVLCIASGIGSFPRLSTAQQIEYTLLFGAALGLVLILAVVVPSIYRGYIRKRKQAGERVLVHQIMLVLYYFPFLTLTIIAAIAVVVGCFMA